MPLATKLLSNADAPASMNGMCAYCSTLLQSPTAIYRLDRLRKIVPHAERANTATFLEEVINYIGQLKAEIATLKGEPVKPVEAALTATDAVTTATNDPTTTVLSGPLPAEEAVVGTSASPTM